MTDNEHVILAGSLRRTSPDTDAIVERIGRVGELWATHFAAGWAVFGSTNGCIDSGLTRDEAERILARYEMTRTSGGA